MLAETIDSKYKSRALKIVAPENLGLNRHYDLVIVLEDICREAYEPRTAVSVAVRTEALHHKQNRLFRNWTEASLSPLEGLVQFDVDDQVPSLELTQPDLLTVRFDQSGYLDSYSRQSMAINPQSNKLASVITMFLVEPPADGCYVDTRPISC